jgi:hypothetical protein
MNISRIVAEIKMFLRRPADPLIYVNIHLTGGATIRVVRGCRVAALTPGVDEQYIEVLTPHAREWINTRHITRIQFVCPFKQEEMGVPE